MKAIRSLAISLCVACGMASAVVVQAQQFVFLVGVRHVYRMHYPDPYWSQRRGIEQQYADQVYDAQQRYGVRVDRGDDPDWAASELSADLDHASYWRDRELGNIYAIDDEARRRHTELVFDQDGPYQILSCQLSGNSFVSVGYYEPWPSYNGWVPFGWQWHHYYPVSYWHRDYHVYHERWIDRGQPAFVPRMVGRRGFVTVDVRRGTTHRFVPAPQLLARHQISMNRGRFVRASGHSSFPQHQTSSFRAPHSAPGRPFGHPSSAMVEHRHAPVSRPSSPPHFTHPTTFSRPPHREQTPTHFRSGPGNSWPRHPISSPTRSEPSRPSYENRPVDRPRSFHPDPHREAPPRRSFQPAPQSRPRPAPEDRHFSRPSAPPNRGRDRPPHHNSKRGD